MKSLPLSLLFIAIFISGCASVKVQPLEPLEAKSTICIEHNDKVIVTDFLNVVRKGFKRNGFDTEVYRDNVPETCKLILSYTANLKWDFTTYLSHAELSLRNKNGKQIGYGEYHLTGGGGLDPSKWSSIESKMNPVIDKLLAQNK